MSKFKVGKRVEGQRNEYKSVNEKHLSNYLHFCKKNRLGNVNTISDYSNLKRFTNCFVLITSHLERFPKGQPC